jgi:hypothetical protein
VFVYSLTARYSNNCLAEVADKAEKCPSGFRCLDLPLSETLDFQGVSLSHITNHVEENREKCTGKLFTIDIPEADFQRWKLLSKNGGQYVNVSYPNASLSDRIGNFPKFGGIRQDKAIYIGLAITGFVYGGLHCLAWNAPFATNAETVLWRVSSVAIMSTFILVFLFYCWERSPPMPFQSFYDSCIPLALFWDPLLGSPSTWDRDFRSARMRWRDGVSWAIAVLLVFLPRLIFDLGVAAAILLYCLARVYLVVECFINLSHLPESVFRVPIWSQYVPHIS